MNTIRPGLAGHSRFVSRIRRRYETECALLPAGSSLVGYSTHLSVALPDTLTLSESGVAGCELNNAYGLFAPVRTPASILQTINSGCNAIIATTRSVTTA